MEYSLSRRRKRAALPIFDAMEERVLCSITVPGTANPYLADPSNATGPQQATDGTIPPSVNVTGDSVLTFSVTGGATNNLGVRPIEPPDGGDFVSSTYGARGAISSWDLPISELAAVFLGTKLGSAPAAYSGSLSATDIAPPLGQVFPIGDGLTGTGTGTQQNFHVPAGATKLYLVDIDGFMWSDNGGQFSVNVNNLQIKLDNLPLDGQYHINASPSMPDIQAELTGIDPSVASSLLVTWVEQVSFDPDDDPTGNADTGSANTIVDTKQTLGTHVTFTQSDIPGEIQGGRVTITATAIVNSQPINVSLSTLPNTTTPIMIIGDNPTAAAVDSYIQSLGTPALAVGSQYNFGRMLEAIIKEESGGVTSPRTITNQFLPSGVPTFNSTGDGGVGLTQITPGQSTIVPRTNADIWNWQTNASDGFKLLSLDLTQANNHFNNDLKAYGPKLPALAARYNFTSVTMEHPTTDQLLLNAVGLYRRPVYYSQYDGESSHQLVPTADPTNPTQGIVELSDGYNDYVDTILGLY
jgi:hypothetical protein